ncbi:hypothetical protein IJ556_04790, partial [bacterium]|nr:hypothetical protein [bacterium]
FINISFGNASADESGIGGAIAATVLEGGDTKASIEEDAQITAKDANVKAAKDDNVYHAVFAYTNAENAKSFGVSSIVISNAVEAYIAGNLNASGNVSVTGDYDKMFLNTTVNGSIANTGQSLANTESDKVLEPGDADDEMPLSWEDFMADEGFSFNKLNIKQAKDILSNHETEKYINPDKKTSAYAGNILLNIADNDVKAYIKDGAKVTADGDVEVKATSEDMNIEIGSILAANGKKGGGATATFDLNKNDVQAYIGAAEVDSAKNINVNAKEDNNIVAVSAGIGQAKDKSGTGVVSLDIQRNNVEAAIKDGAKVNTNIDNENQSVSVNAEFDNSLVKAVGALSIQAGEGDGGSVGAAVDGDVAVNDVKAYIKGAEINASNELNVTAEQETNLIDLSAAGAVSTQGAAYDGTGAVYVSSGNTDAYIENSQINQTEGRENNGVSTKVSAENTYDNITVTGTLAGGKGNAVGGSIRVDWIDDNVDSYIKDSILDSTGALEMSNNSTVDVVA